MIDHQVGHVASQKCATCGNSIAPGGVWHHQSRQEKENSAREFSFAKGLSGGNPVRKRNYRFVAAGLFLIVVAAVFFLSMLGLAPQSNDPAQMLKVAGQAAGVATGVGLAVAIIGLVGRKTA
jgi:hypothetical protein